MSTSNATIGAGTLLGFSLGYNTSGFTNLAELYEVVQPPEKAADAEVTHYLSPGLRKEYVPGWSEGGDVEAKLNYVASNQATVNSLMRQLNTYRITMPDAHTWIFNGYVNSRGGDIPNGEKITTTIGIKISGPPVFT